MNGDEIGTGIDFVEVLQQFHLEGLGARHRKIRIEGQHLHAKGDGASRHFAADTAHAKNTEGLAVKLDSLEALAVPFARLHGGVRLGDFARQRHEHRKRQLSGGDGVAAGRVHHHDAALRGGFYIDIVHANAGPTNDL